MTIFGQCINVLNYKSENVEYVIKRYLELAVVSSYQCYDLHGNNVMNP